MGECVNRERGVTMADETKPLGTADEMQKLMDAAARGRCDGDGPADVSEEYKAAHAGGDANGSK